MKTTLVTVMLMLALAASAQSIDTTTVQPSSDYLDFDRVKIEIALHQYDTYHVFSFETDEACGLVLVSESDVSMMEATQKKETQGQ